ncbi:MAG: cache domain-containing protein, partial [Candidatus Omnitrophota bacterium]
MTQKARYKISIRKKIILAIFLSVFTVMSLTAALGYFWSVGLLRKTIGNDHLKMAQLFSAAITRIIDEEVSDLKVYMSHEARIEEAQNSNLKYKVMSQKEMKNYFEEKDRRWIADVPDNEFVKSLLSTPVSKRLTSIKNNDEGLAEIMIADAFGGLVAASGKTSDFYQADEKWWHVAYDKGKGAVFIEGLKVDESSRSLSISLAIPVKNSSGEVVGVCKAVLDVKRLFLALENFKFGKSGHVALVDSTGDILFHPATSSNSEKFLKPQGMEALLRNSQGYKIIDESGIHKYKMLIAWATVEQPAL